MTDKTCDECIYYKADGFCEINKSIVTAISYCDSWKQEKDNVNHPKHYETGKFECIDVMGEVFGSDNLKEYCLINAFKYLYRCKRKEKELEDIKKSIWYLNKYVELQEGDQK